MNNLRQAIFRNVIVLPFICGSLLLVWSCSSTSAVPIQALPFVPSDSLWQQAYSEQGVLLAFGTEPDWLFRLDQASNAVIHLSDKKRPIQIQDWILRATEAGGYQLESREGVLLLKRESCQEVQTGNIMPFAAEWEYNGQLYNGCVQLLYDKRVNDRWRLATVGEKPASEMFEGPVPVLLIEPNRLSITGQAGCNKVRGGAHFYGKSCRFDRLVTTKMACGDLRAEQTFLQNLKAANSYQIEAAMLQLFDEHGDRLLVFQKMGQ